MGDSREIFFHGLSMVNPAPMFFHAAAEWEPGHPFERAPPAHSIGGIPAMPENYRCPSFSLEPKG